MRKLTEEDVFLYHENLIQKAASLCRKGIPWDDCLMAANEGFLDAIRGYRKEFSDFPSYAEKCIYMHIKNAKKEYNRIRRVDSRLSLDMPIEIGGNKESIGSVFFSSQGDFINSVILTDFLGSLKNEEKVVAYMCIQEYTSEEIMRLRCISRDKLNQCKKVICELWQQYNLEIYEASYL